MSPQELHLKLQGVFRQVFDRAELEIRDDMTALDIPDWDSLAHINLVVGVEEAFGVRFQSAQIRALKNVGEFKQLIAQKLEAQQR